MMCLTRTTALSLTMLLASLAAPALARAAEPATAASMAPIDCSTAGTQMTQMMQPTSAAMPAATTSGKAMSGDAMNVDKTFSTNMMAMMQHGHMMAAIEMQCGKDPATRAQAKQLFDDTAKYTQQAMKQGQPL